MPPHDTTMLAANQVNVKCKDLPLGVDIVAMVCNHVPMMTTTHKTFTKSEFAARLRACKAVAAKANGYNPRALTAQVGVRVKQEQSIMDTFDEDALHIDGDDLSDFIGTDHAAADSLCARHGSVVHLYLYTRPAPNDWYDSGELVDVVTCWMGTPDADPMMQVPGNGIMAVTL